MLTPTAIATIAFAAFLVIYALSSVIFVYGKRGTLRFESFGEYVRKGWPIFAPVNCLLYLSTKRRARRAIMDLDEFKELDEIRDNWEVIREEAVQLLQNKAFDKTNSQDEGAAYYDLGFRTFYKYGWSKFYLRWYGYTHHSAREMCPKTAEIVSRCKAVNGAMFSVLPPGSKLTRHLDPLACSLRFHLGLDTPEDDKCFIDVDGDTYSWRNGEALLFDETYLHYARNDTENHRLILMCDVERPMGFFGRFFNGFFKVLMRFTVVPNTSVDRRGLVNRIFSTISPTFARVRSLKKTNKTLYKIIKNTFNLLLVLIALSIIAGVFYGITWLFGLLVS